ncbi:MAG TPA: ester cyclase [Kofleriaceae bacterium]
MRLTAMCAALAVMSCGKKDAQDKPAPGSAVGSAAHPEAAHPDAAPPPAKFATPEAKLQRYQSCLADFNANKDSYASCFAKDAVREQMDNVPELVVKGADKISDAAKAQHASYPDLVVTPTLVIASGSDVIAILYVTGTNTGNVEELAATGKKIGLFEGERVTISDDGSITHDRIYADQPTIYHQLGLVPNDTSPAAKPRKLDPVVTLTAANNSAEAANKTLIEANLAAISQRNVQSVVASAAPNIQLVYHGDKQKVATKKAFQAWLDDSVKSTSDGKVTIEHAWTAGDYVVVEDTFTGTPSEAIAGKGAAKKIESHVLEFFRVTGGKLVEQQIFGNRLKVAVDLGMIDPAELADTLSKHK